LLLEDVEELSVDFAGLLHALRVDEVGGAPARRVGVLLPLHVAGFKIRGKQQKRAQAEESFKKKAASRSG
jgi:hypothetical protein